MKSSINKIIAGAAMVGLLTPMLMFAQTSTTAPVNAKNPAAFCINVDVITNQVYTIMLQTQAYYNTSRNLSVANAAYATMDGVVGKATAEAYASAMNARVYNGLQARAKTQDQKDAITEFKAVYDAALAKMKASNDLAITSFRTETNKVVASRNSVVSDSMMVYNTSINSAISKAKADCKSSVDSATAYSTFTTAVKAANQAVSVKSKMGDLKPLIQPLNQKLSADLKASSTAFKDTVKPAWQKLAGTFKVPATTDAQ